MVVLGTKPVSPLRSVGPAKLSCLPFNHVWRDLVYMNNILKIKVSCYEGKYSQRMIFK